MTTVAVSILNYNGAQSTIDCIHSLLAAGKVVQEECRLVIFLADNASDKEDQELLQESLGEMDTVRLRINDRNLGFSAGHNRNIEKIFAELNPDYVWLLNNDCLVEKNAIHVLLDCARKRPKVGLWGTTLLEPDGETIQCAGGCFYNSWISSYRSHGRGKHLSKIGSLKSRQFDYVAGASLFFHAGTLTDGLIPAPGTEGISPGNKWLNEEFFLYFEELDLAKRLKPGFQMAWCKGARVLHSGSNATDGDATRKQRRKEIAEYHSTLSALKFTRCYYPYRLWIVMPSRYLAKCLLLLWKGELRSITAMTKAYRRFWGAIS